MCEVCANVHNQIRRYHLSQEEGRPFILTKFDVLANVLFPMSWNQRQCLCCFKDTKNYEAYNNIIQMVIVTAIRLLQNLPDEGRILRCVESSASLEVQSEIPANDAVWTLVEVEQLLNFISSSLVMTFPLYIICKHNHICGVEELTSQEASILGTYCDITDADSLPVMLLRNVCFFCDSGGPQTINKCLDEYPALVTISILHGMTACLSNLKLWLTNDAVESYVFLLKPTLVRYICSMSDDELRLAGNRCITDMVASLIKEPTPAKALSDPEYLKLSFKYFSSSTLTIRMAGLQQLNSQVALLAEALNTQTDEDLERAGALLSEWLVTNRIIEHIFGPNLHNELVKQSQTVLNFLANEGKITPEHIDVIWTSAMQKHCARQVLDVLSLLVKHLNPAPLVHLMDLLVLLDVSAHTEQTLFLMSNITKVFWLLRTREQKSKITIKSSNNGADNEISVCSTDDESEDSESDYEMTRAKQLQHLTAFALPGTPNRRASLTANPVEAFYETPLAGKRVGCTTPEADQQDTSEDLLSTLPETVSAVLKAEKYASETPFSGKLPAIITGQQTHVSEVSLRDLDKVIPDRLVRSPVGSSSVGSAKSDKNMADFDGEDFVSDEELNKLHELHSKKQIIHGARQSHSQKSPLLVSPCSPHEMRQVSGALWPDQLYSIDQASIRYLDLERVCDPGHTPLWDLIQDDLAHQLPEGLANEAEKLLGALICSYDVVAEIKLAFVKAFITNIRSYKSSTVSLRLLPKAISSVHVPFRGVQRDAHETTLYVEETLSMMAVFFSNLCNFRLALNEQTTQYSSLHGLESDIKVRLHFLSFVFSYVASPESFRLTKEQIDILWKCLAMDKDTCDLLFNWLFTQIRSRECHALTLETYKYIYTEKLTQLNLKDLTMTGFKLFHLLHEMLSQSDKQIKGHNTQLWEVALKSKCTEVSREAIDYLNNSYMSDNDVTREPEFIDRCMKCLKAALTTLATDAETSLQVIQRGLYLLKHHIDCFKQKYAFQLRMMQLRGIDCHSHQPPSEEKGAQLLKLTLSATAPKAFKGLSVNYKATVDVLATTLLGELRADVAFWWSKLGNQQKAEPSVAGSAADYLQVNDAFSIRLLANGIELTNDMDKRTLQSLDIKPDQVILVSVSSNRQKLKRDVGSSTLNPQLIPMNILVQQPHFNQLLTMLEMLSGIEEVIPESAQNRHVVCSKAKLLSRRVWDLLMAVPTNPTIHGSLMDISVDTSNSWKQLLDPTQPYKLIYSLQVVESLSQPTSRHKPCLTVALSDTDRLILSSGDHEDSSSLSQHDAWSVKFILDGGLSHLFEILAQRKLQQDTSRRCHEWNQEALAYLLKLMSQFAIIKLENPAQESLNLPDVPEATFTANSLLTRKDSVQRCSVPTLNKMMLAMLNSMYTDIFSIIHNIIYEAASQEASQSAVWSRLEVIHYAMAFMIYWAYSEESVEASLASTSDPTFCCWLRRLTLEVPESQIRQEACKSIYKLCLGKSAKQGGACSPYLALTLSALKELLPHAASMEPMMKEMHEPAENRKPTLGASCQDYLWLIGQLIDASDPVALTQFDLLSVAEQLRLYIKKRKFYEQRHSAAEDEGLIGLLNLLATIVKHNVVYKNSSQAKELVSEVFDYLFSLPCLQRRYLPKCKSNASRCAAFDLLVELTKGCSDNYLLLHSILMKQHDQNNLYPWDYWPMEDVRSVSGYVGLQNLGATCYMATCMQHLYMIPQARQVILQASCDRLSSRYSDILYEIKKMFAYLMESERKSYNPEGFCKVYEMNRQPLNTGEQKDMTEFFTDLIGKLEEMSPELKSLVKDLFGGVTSNNVVSRDCAHVSRRLEEFYTVRCQVADMKNLHESIDEFCVKDTLDGDNMYTCSQCQKKVRAEKRTCFKRLPKILCFNTMRYTFNMVTMLKEKVNTHFSFPHQLNMADYMESNLLKSDTPSVSVPSCGDLHSSQTTDESGMDYELIGITVHTGTADGGHYYSFIRDRVSSEPGKPDKWFLFNDSEVKPFDPAQIGQECFGGEMTSTTYDTIADKFMDFSFEKTNSAYMLFYERVNKSLLTSPAAAISSSDEVDCKVPRRSFSDSSSGRYKFELSEELADWIWRDNTSFLQDKNIFCHNYFGFMWQMCAYVPTTLPKENAELKILPAQLSASFLLETFIHAKEKPTMVQWMELLTKQFNQCHDACEWLLEKMCGDDHWSRHILINCSNQTIRQMFQRLIIHVITQLKNKIACTSTGCVSTSPATSEARDALWLSDGCVVGKFILKQLNLLQQPEISQTSCKYLTEFFAFLYEFTRLGNDEKKFLLVNNTISKMVSFYVGNPDRTSSTDSQNGDTSNEEEEDALTALAEERFKVTSLEKMVHLIALLVESCRDEQSRTLRLCSNDMDHLIGSKGMKFIINQIKDGINPKQTCSLIFSLCRWNSSFAANIIDTILQTVLRTNNKAHCQSFLKMLTLLTEVVDEQPGQPQFTDLVLAKFWMCCERKPLQFLEWMSNLVSHNQIAHNWIRERLNDWVEQYLLAHSVQKVRAWAMMLLVHLVPSQAFRNHVRNSQSLQTSKKTCAELRSQMAPEALAVLHEIFNFLLELMPAAKKYADIAAYGTTHLVSYFTFLNYCLISKQEKLMFLPKFSFMWQMFQPKMTDPQISINLNKQSLLHFWYSSCQDCPESVALITTNPLITKNIAFNYILADHDDQEVVLYNRNMLPAYYGLLRLCCEHTVYFTKHLAQHQNLIWAFQHIVPFPHHYTAAAEELLGLLQVIVNVPSEASTEEHQAIASFKRKLLNMYQQSLNPRTDSQTIITVLKIVLVTDEDRLMYLVMGGLATLTEVFSVIHSMYHEATTCLVLNDLCDTLTLLVALLKVAKTSTEDTLERKTLSLADGTETSLSFFALLNSWDRTLLTKNCLTLLNSYSPSEVRSHSLDVLKKLVLLFPETIVTQLSTQLLAQHAEFQGMETPNAYTVLDGPYLPSRSNTKSLHAARINVRPPQAQFGMFLHHNTFEELRCQDTTYDQAMSEFYFPYHMFVDFMMRVAVNKKCLTEDLVNLGALIAYEGIPLHSAYFAKLWCEIYQTEKSDKSLVKLLCGSNYLIDYMESILHDDRSCLNNQHIYLFFTYYFKLVHQSVLCDESSLEGVTLIASIAQSLVTKLNIANTKAHISVIGHILGKANGDLRALQLIYHVQPPEEIDVYVFKVLQSLRSFCLEHKARLEKMLSELSHSCSSTAEKSSEDDSGSSSSKPASPSTPHADQEVPCKKVKISSESPMELCAIDGQESREKGDLVDRSKVILEYRPSEKADEKKSRKGPTSQEKGKAPAKRCQTLQTNKDRHPFYHAKQLGASSSATSSTKEDLISQSEPSTSAEATIKFSSSESLINLHADNPPSNPEAFQRLTRKLDHVSSMLCTADSILGMFEKLKSKSH